MNQEEFIQENKLKSTSEVALLLSKYPDLDKKFILNQIHGLQKAKKKLPEFYQTNGIQFPVSLSMEQCSSEETAVFKSKLVEGSSLVDLTGGFGIDSYYFSKCFDSVVYVEPNKELNHLVQQNFEVLNTLNVQPFIGTAEEFLEKNNHEFDVAYIDPSRRSESNRVFKLEDCTPNIVELQPSIFKIAEKIIIKTAPLLDIKQSLADLSNVKKVVVVSLKNDCKEVLYILDRNYEGTVTIETINIDSKLQEYTFSFEEEVRTIVAYDDPKAFLYEPNSSILKAGAFKSLANNFKLKKIAEHSHLYTSSELIKNFPGRIFTIVEQMPYQVKPFKKRGIKKANITCRNFKQKVDDVRKKLKIKEGGKHYIFATQNQEGKPILILCEKA